ncbi:hypothetical protein J8273_3299 [Carpediemonas membranifera]|uniref:Uncharacterized protein n=1 Tax=Carpediemonas membranifera TaxID=201153 RepID=A0A8J6AUZ8_9EUKA|nr:hypothetical protein J8273_3299 [Carpediemonas membranifera]|eukprot:KAG9393170.1 hypothetical protein J8273_3299 [Carpediemonas membranifera]
MYRQKIYDRLRIYMNVSAGKENCLFHVFGDASELKSFLEKVRNRRMIIIVALPTADMKRQIETAALMHSLPADTIEHQRAALMPLIHLFTAIDTMPHANVQLTTNFDALALAQRLAAHLSHHQGRMQTDLKNFIVDWKAFRHMRADDSVVLQTTLGRSVLRWSANKGVGYRCEHSAEGLANPCERCPKLPGDTTEPLGDFIGLDTRPAARHLHNQPPPILPQTMWLALPVPFLLNRVPADMWEKYGHRTPLFISGPLLEAAYYGIPQYRAARPIQPPVQRRAPVELPRHIPFVVYVNRELPLPQVERVHSYTALAPIIFFVQTVQRVHVVPCGTRPAGTKGNFGVWYDDYIHAHRPAFMAPYAVPDDYPGTCVIVPPDAGRCQICQPDDERPEDHIRGQHHRINVRNHIDQKMAALHSLQNSVRLGAAEWMTDGNVVCDAQAQPRAATPMGLLGIECDPGLLETAKRFGLLAPDGSVPWIPAELQVQWTKIAQLVLEPADAGYTVRQSYPVVKPALGTAGNCDLCGNPLGGEMPFLACKKKSCPLDGHKLCCVCTGAGFNKTPLKPFQQGKLHMFPCPFCAHEDPEDDNDDCWEAVCDRVETNRAEAIDIGDFSGYMCYKCHSIVTDETGGTLCDGVSCMDAYGLSRVVCDGCKELSFPGEDGETFYCSVCRERQSRGAKRPRLGLMS